MSTERLIQIRKQADDIFYSLTTSPQNLEDRQKDEDYVVRLEYAVDHLARTVAMFAERELDVSKDIYDPLGYIEGKLSIAHGSLARYMAREKKD